MEAEEEMVDLEAVLPQPPPPPPLPPPPIFTNANLRGHVTLKVPIHTTSFYHSLVLPSLQIPHACISHIQIFFFSFLFFSFLSAVFFFTLLFHYCFFFLSFFLIVSALFLSTVKKNYFRACGFCLDARKWHSFVF